MTQLVSIPCPGAVSIAFTDDLLVIGMRSGKIAALDIFSLPLMNQINTYVSDKVTHGSHSITLASAPDRVFSACAKRITLWMVNRSLPFLPTLQSTRSIDMPILQMRKNHNTVALQTSSNFLMLYNLDLMILSTLSLEHSISHFALSRAGIFTSMACGWNEHDKYTGEKLTIPGEKVILHQNQGSCWLPQQSWKCLHSILSLNASDTHFYLRKQQNAHMLRRVDIDPQRPHSDIETSGHVYDIAEEWLLVGTPYFLELFLCSTKVTFEASTPMTCALYDPKTSTLYACHEPQHPYLA